MKNYRFIKKKLIIAVLLLLYILLTTLWIGCPQPDKSSDDNDSSKEKEDDDGGIQITEDFWTWISGSNTINQTGVYGTKGIGAGINIPGARVVSISWIDAAGNLWLFGGSGYDSAGDNGRLNDLWKYDGTNWTWISGSNLRYESGVYGTKGVGAGTNIPGARESSISWIDSGGSLWLFGGYGYSSGGAPGRLNDLWKYDGTNWTWISGSDTTNQTGVYGTKGTGAGTNIPGARNDSISWIDASGNLWLFGGWGYDSAGNDGRLNDLWKYDGTNWTWISGSDLRNQTGVYGSKGVGAGTNIPGARRYSISWIDASGNLWLFGGDGYDSGVFTGFLNDLWKFDGTNWTWISGSDTINQSGVYGTKGVGAGTNMPRARQKSISWIDASGNLWLFDGEGYDNSGVAIGHFNDLWKYDGTNWTWISGSDTTNQSGVYGTKSIGAVTNIPGARSNCINWIDSGGNLWIFGGHGYDSAGNNGNLNDLWKYVP